MKLQFRAVRYLRKRILPSVQLQILIGGECINAVISKADYTLLKAMGVLGSGGKGRLDEGVIQESAVFDVPLTSLLPDEPKEWAEMLDN